jgi:SOS response regulatory protein OraA/RecX
VDAAVAEAAIREALSPETELARALEAARRRLPALVKRAPARLRDYLLRRGYPAGVVTRVVRTLCALSHDEPD